MKKDDREQAGAQTLNDTQLYAHRYKYFCVYFKPCIWFDIHCIQLFGLYCLILNVCFSVMNPHLLVLHSWTMFKTLFVYFIDNFEGGLTLVFAPKSSPINILHLWL